MHIARSICLEYYCSTFKTSADSYKGSGASTMQNAAPLVLLSSTLLYISCTVQVRPSTVIVDDRPTGGNVMAHATTYRIMLRKAGKARIAIMVDSPYHMYDQTRFSITEAGVQDVEEYKNSTSEW